MQNPSDNQSYVDSAMLANLRQLAEAYPALQNVAGPLMRFRAVIDANTVASDLIHKCRNPHVKKTAIEEVVAASVLEIHAPRWLDTEIVESTIPQVALRDAISAVGILT